MLAERSWTGKIQNRSPKEIKYLYIERIYLNLSLTNRKKSLEENQVFLSDGVYVVIKNLSLNGEADASACTSELTLIIKEWSLCSEPKERCQTLFNQEIKTKEIHTPLHRNK